MWTKNVFFRLMWKTNTTVSTKKMRRGQYCFVSLEISPNSWKSWQFNPLSRQVGWFSLTFPLRNNYLPCDFSMSELRPSLIYDLGQLCPVFFVYGMFSGLCSKVYKLQTPTAPYARFSFTPKAVFCQLILTTKANIAPNVTNIGWIWHGVGVWPTMFGLEKIRT